ncbi:tRNA 2-thiouridine(34) synthase MnmA [Rhizomicrobium palustre]
MSGGVDSSVTAALLQRAGHEVVGITLQLYSGVQQRKGACCAGQDIYDAKRVADKLGISHYVLDYEERFKKAVIEDFADSYARGETPIPCVRCNERVKFADLLQAARDLGADALATGHYVQRLDGPNGAEMHRAVDDSRDQSYFLFATTREQLSYLQFPLGGMTKPRVREIAAELGLVNAEKPDSQDICFVSTDYTDVVRRLQPLAGEPGDIVDEQGNVLGQHAGVMNFTVGQRKGLGLSGREEPLFVVQIDASNRRVVVGPRTSLAASRIVLQSVNWLADPSEAAECFVKIRSMRAPVPARVRATSTGAEVELAVPEEAVAPGQACVFYAGTKVLGGGWIARD